MTDHEKHKLLIESHAEFLKDTPSKDLIIDRISDLKGLIFTCVFKSGLCKRKHYDTIMFEAFRQVESLKETL